ncbi:MAG: DUF3443 family protein, partial [Burkholderiales bacterium]|nr:DUF3443 family protein [Burkholderiales bacterium]
MKNTVLALLASLLVAVLPLEAQAGLSAMSSSPSGPLSANKLSVTVVADTADNDVPKSVWVAAYVPNVGFFFHNANNQWVAWNGGTMPALQTTSANTVTIDALGGSLDLRGLPGTQVYVGFAQSSSEMLSNGDYTLVYTVPANVNNVTPIIIDSGPAVTVSSGGSQNNLAYVTVKICVPGTTTCTYVDHIQVDTGSEGLRILSAALDPAFSAQLPQRVDSQARPIGECLEFVDGYVWGSVRSADFTIGGEQVSSMPIQLVDASFSGGAPTECSSSGGHAENDIATFGANGIIGIGPQLYDCGTTCVRSATLQYYGCVGGVCTEAALPLANQVPNPVAMFANDNNGTIIELPAAPVTGEQSTTGTLVFGIGTQSNNGLGSASVYTISAQGMFNTTYKSVVYKSSYVDSGTSILSFPDSSIPQCSATNTFFCPTSTLNLSAVNTGLNGVSGTVQFSVANTNNLNGAYAVLPALA